MKKFTKVIIILATLICWAASVGAVVAPFTQPVKFKNVNGPLIDLAVMVGDLPIGQEGSAEKSEESSEAEKDGTGSGTETELVTPVDNAEKELVITVSNEDVTVNGEKLRDADALKVHLAIHYRNNTSAVLVDDYAEWNTYRKVMKVLRDSGIVPEERQSDGKEEQKT